MSGEHVETLVHFSTGGPQSVLIAFAPLRMRVIVR